MFRPLLCLLLLLGTAGICAGAGPAMTQPAATPRSAVPQPDAALYVPGREDDARVEHVFWRLALAGRRHCPQLAPSPGLVLQHLSQFERQDRAGVLAVLPLDRGPGVTVVEPGGPAAAAGIMPGDVLLALDGAALPPEPGLADAFDATAARAREDRVADLLQAARSVTLLRDGAQRTVGIAPVPVCPSHLHLARSGQQNAFSDGRHVLLTTGILRLLRNDDEVAFLVAHEMAHNILGHAKLMRSGTVHGRAVREIETAADLLGGRLMLDAGFDPVRGATLLKRIGGPDLGIALFSQHEPAGKRIAALRALVRTRDVP